MTESEAIGRAAGHRALAARSVPLPSSPHALLPGSRRVCRSALTGNWGARNVAALAGLCRRGRSGRWSNFNTGALTSSRARIVSVLRCRRGKACRPAQSFDDCRGVVRGARPLQSALDRLRLANSAHVHRKPGQCLVICLCSAACIKRSLSQGVARADASGATRLLAASAAA